MNSNERLVFMANQIARNLATMPDDRAAAELADHIHAFWDPRMKAGIFAHRDGLVPVAAHAVEILERGPPGSQTRATEFNAADEAGGSDAG